MTLSQTTKLTLTSILFLSLLLLSVNPVQAQRNNSTVQQKQQNEAKVLYQVLLAEMYHQYGEDLKAIDSYQKVLSLTDDFNIAKRATILSTANARFNEALIAAKKWVDLAPDVIEARQYLALLHLRHQQFDSSVSELQQIRELVSAKYLQNNADKEVASREGLAFLGALLAQEAHHEKALIVFEKFLQKDDLQAAKLFNQKPQQKLILANLAMKAKDYRKVVEALSDGKYSGYDEQNKVDAISLKAKALRKLNRSEEAISLLESIQNNKNTADSSRLELVRLWVLNKRKNKALRLLLKLVDKHEKNYELLKSLVALQLDLKQLNKVQKNIELLKSQKGYIDDAYYFSGELYKHRHQPKLAILQYEKVAGGAFLKHAHKKIIRLKGKLEGRESLDKWFEVKLNRAEKIGDQAYWLKLHGDSLFDDKKYHQALIAYNRAVTLSPKKTRYRYQRALLNERLKNYEDAEKDLSYILKRRKNDVDALNTLGYMLVENTDRIDEAISYLQKALDIKPYDPAILDSMGWAKFKMGDYEVAKSYLQKAYDKIKSPEIASHLIQTLSALGLKQQAKVIYKDIKAKYPDNEFLVTLQEYLH